MVPFSWIGTTLRMGAPAIAIWAILCSSIHGQQTRLVFLAPNSPVVLGLNNPGVYLGVTTAGLIGAAARQIKL